MLSPSKWNPVFCLFLGLATWLSERHAEAQLDMGQQILLEQMDATFAAKSVEAVVKVKDWRRRIAKAKPAAGGSDANGGDAEALAAVILEIASELKVIADSHPKIARIVNYEHAVQPILSKANEGWQTVPFNAQEYPNLNEKQFREKVRRELMVQASLELRKYLENDVFRGLETYDAPAKYTLGFLNGKFKEWLSSPMPISEGAALHVKLIAPAANVSVFSKAADLGVEVEYLPERLTLRAKGLYFQYRPGGVPEPVVENLRMEGDYQKTTFDNVQSLGMGLLSESIDSPIKVTLKGKPAFTEVQGKRGGIPFDVEFSVLEKVTVKGADLLLLPGNDVDWKDGRLKLDYKSDSPVPFPGAPTFAFWDITGEYNTQQAELAFETKIASSAVRPDPLALAVRCGTTFPVKHIDISGQLLVGNVAIAESDGKLDFSNGNLDASFKATGAISELIPGFSLGEGRLHLERERLMVTSTMNVFGAGFDDMRAELSFADASGVLTANQGFEIFGADFSQTLEASIGPGFSHLELRAVGAVEVNGIEPFPELQCSVEILGDSRKLDDPLTIVVKTFRSDLDITISVARLSDCTIGLLERELRKKAGEAYYRFLREFVALGEDMVRLAALWDVKSRKWLMDRSGKVWESGVAALEDLSRDIVPELAEVGGDVLSLPGELGGNLTEVVESVVPSIKPPKENPLSKVTSWRPRW